MKCSFVRRGVEEWGERKWEWERGSGGGRAGVREREDGERTADHGVLRLEDKEAGQRC